MKKVVYLGIAIFSLFVLAGCKSTSIEAAISDTDITIDSFTATVTIDDPNSEITGNIYFKLFDADDEVVNSKAIEFEDGETSYEGDFTFTSLDEATDYTVSVVATIGKKTKDLVSYEFTTQNEDDIYITTAEEFLGMTSNRTGNYVLSNDIDFTDVEFETPFPSGKNFSGTFDGQGFTLSNITFTEVDTYTGVFGYVSSGEITNLNFDHVTIGTEEAPLDRSNSSRVGIVAGYMSSATGSISDVTVMNSSIYYTSDSTVTTYVGGVIGEMRGDLTNATVENTVINLTSVGTSQVNLGGIVGYLYTDASILEASSTGSIDFTLNGDSFGDEDGSYINIGGVVGSNISSSVNDIYSMMDITAIVNYNTLEETESAAYGFKLGGLIGDSLSNVKNGFFGGSISVTHEASDFESVADIRFYIGGLVGLITSTKNITGLVRFGNGATITVNTSDNVHVYLSQIIGYGVGSSDISTKAGVYGSDSVTLNGNDYDDSLLVLTDLSTFFSSDWISDAFAAINVG